MSDMTPERIEREFRRQVFLCGSLGFDTMTQIVDQFFTDRHELIHSPTSYNFRCAAERCPGYPYKASFLAHPLNPCGESTEDAKGKR